MNRGSLFVACALILLGTMILSLLPTALFQQSATRWCTEEWITVVGLLIAYVVACAWLLWRRLRGLVDSHGMLLGILVMSYAPTLLAFLMARQLPGRSLLAVMIGAGWLLAVLAVAVDRLRTARLAAFIVAAMALAGVQAAYSTGVLPRPPAPSMSASSLDSLLYGLKESRFKAWIPVPRAHGGGFARVGDALLLATGDGDLYRIDPDPERRRMAVVRLPYVVPINADAFIAAAPAGVKTADFRVADLLAQVSGDRTRLFASHHYWKALEQCFVVRVSLLEAPTAQLLKGAPGFAWSTLFESSPCVPIRFPGGTTHFEGSEVGGRIIALNDDEILLAVGSNGLDGWTLPVSAPQDPRSSYGKTVLIHVPDGRSAVYSMGHRNPQGLLKDDAGVIWSTEHGPRGGDELNIIERDENYGFPLVSYGVQYHTHTWPYGSVPGNHDGYRQPVFSWGPSTGLSNLIQYDGPLFSEWVGDYLIGSLKNKAIFRVRIREGRAVHIERIQIGQHLRDIEQDADGRLVLWTDEGTVISVSPDADTTSGPGLFRACQGCHALEDGTEHGIGPDLFGVVGRKIGAAEGFQFSPALAARGGTWTPEALDAFLADPQHFAPGTSMQFAGLPDAEGRARIIELLGSGQRLGAPPDEH